MAFFRLIWEVTSREEDKDSSLQSEATQPTLMYARWMSSPADANTGESGSSTDAILFVEDYNIFYIPDVGIEEKRIFPLSQTEVVKPEVIFHGIPDWIYEGTIIPYLVFMYLGIDSLVPKSTKSGNFSKMPKLCGWVSQKVGIARF